MNLGSGFSHFFPGNLENTGTAENYGAELTIEKYFSKKFFFLMTTSLYNSTYKGSDGIKRNTDFNGNYIFKTKNVLKLSYAPNPADPTLEPIREEYQLGFLPIFYYKADF